MTVIAWDGKKMAADRQGSNGGLRHATTKIHRIDRLLVGGCGEPSLLGNMFEWVRRGRKIEEFPASQRDKDDWQVLLVIEPVGSEDVPRILFYERTPHPIVYEQRCAACGSGRDFAMAAMHLGFDAVKAVEVAIALDVGCGVGIDTLTMNAGQVAT